MCDSAQEAASDFQAGLRLYCSPSTPPLPRHFPSPLSLATTTSFCGLLFAHQQARKTERIGVAILILFILGGAPLIHASFRPRFLAYDTLALLKLFTSTRLSRGFHPQDVKPIGTPKETSGHKPEDLRNAGL